MNLTSYTLGENKLNRRVNNQMMRKEKIYLFSVFIIALVLIFTGCGNSSKDTSEEPEEPVVDPIEERIKTMTNEEILGQMLIFQIKGVQRVEDNFAALAKSTNCANFMLLENNCYYPEQVGELITNMNLNNPHEDIPFWYCIDEEGGSVSRLRLGLPSARNTAESEDPVGRAYENGNTTGSILSGAGVNLCLAPVVDVAENLKTASLGDRIFSSDPAVVTELASSFIKGLHDNGVASTIKHFPGVGNSRVDSHFSFPKIEGTREEVESFDLVPFRNIIESGADVVMVGHLIMPAFDGENPASLSRIIVTDFLRGEWGYNGVVMTDDMSMDSITSKHDLAEACLQAILAGSDMLIIQEDEQRVYDRLLLATQDGTLPRERLEESMYRILELKWKYQ